MIYDFPSRDDRIRQGDIFLGLPRVDLSLDEFSVLTEDGDIRKRTWTALAGLDTDPIICLAVRSTAAIVVSQDCDIAHGEYVTLCEIRTFRDVERKSRDTPSAKTEKWMRMLTQQARLNQKWFYLPPDDRVDLPDKMAVDFRVTLRLSQADLKRYIGLRKGRLNEVADEHFRERIAEFYRRYPYNEWYPLDRDELAVYRGIYPDAAPYPWQTATTGEGESTS